MGNKVLIQNWLVSIILALFLTACAGNQQLTGSPINNTASVTPVSADEQVDGFIAFTKEHGAWGDAHSSESFLRPIPGKPNVNDIFSQIVEERNGKAAQKYLSFCQQELGVPAYLHDMCFIRLRNEIGQRYVDELTNGDYSKAEDIWMLNEFIKAGRNNTLDAIVAIRGHYSVKDMLQVKAFEKLLAYGDFIQAESLVSYVGWSDLKKRDVAFGFVVRQVYNYYRGGRDVTSLNVAKAVSRYYGLDYAKIVSTGRVSAVGDMSYKRFKAFASDFNEQEVIDGVTSYFVNTVYNSANVGRQLKKLVVLNISLDDPRVAHSLAKVANAMLYNAFKKCMAGGHSLDHKISDPFYQVFNSPCKGSDFETTDYLVTAANIFDAAPLTKLWIISFHSSDPLYTQHAQSKMVVVSGLVAEKKK